MPVRTHSRPRGATQTVTRRQSRPTEESSGTHSCTPAPPGCEDETPRCLTWSFSTRHGIFSVSVPDVPDCTDPHRQGGRRDGFWERERRVRERHCLPECDEKRLPPHNPYLLPPVSRIHRHLPPLEFVVGLRRSTVGLQSSHPPSRLPRPWSEIRDVGLQSRSESPGTPDRAQS